MRKSLALLGILALIGCKPAATGNETAQANEAAANEVAETAPAIPDMKGTWVGTSESIVTGMTKHHEAPSGDKPLLDNVDFTYVVEGQDGHRFWGTLSSPNFEEDMTGVVTNDGKGIVARSSEGEVRGTFTNADTLDIVYSAGGRSTVVAVNTWKRTAQK
jgi:hypothetical protein